MSRKKTKRNHKRIMEDGKRWVSEDKHRTFEYHGRGSYSYGEGNIPTLPIEKSQVLHALMKESQNIMELSVKAVEWLLKHQTQFKIVGERSVDGNLIDEWVFVNISFGVSYLLNQKTRYFKSHTPVRDLNAVTSNIEIEMQQKRCIFNHTTFKQKDNMLLEFIEKKARDYYLTELKV